MAQLTLIVDRPPGDPAQWMLEVLRARGFTVVTVSAVADWLAEDPKAQEALLGLRGPSAEVGEHYRRALEALAPNAAKRALCGTAWLAYLSKVDAAILDLGGLEEEAKRGISQGIPQAEAQAYVERFSKETEATLRQGTSQLLVFGATTPRAELEVFLSGL